jgi:hypothetical protein
MKLGALKTHIRSMTEAPKAQMRFGGGQVLTLTLQKTPLLAELDTVFPEGKAQETGLAFTHDGFLTMDDGSDQ